MFVATINDRKFRAKDAKLIQRAKNTTPLMKLISEDMMRAVNNNFDAEGRPKKWQDLKPATKKARARKNKWPGKILQVSRQLKNSHTARFTKTTSIVGTNKKYAGFVRDGTKHMDGRNFQNLTTKDMSGINKRVKLWFSAK